MARLRKDYKILSCRIERSIYEQLDKFCEQSGQARSVVVKRILKNCIQDYFPNKNVTFMKDRVVR